jgi:hypothetical protein
VTGRSVLTAVTRRMDTVTNQESAFVGKKLRNIFYLKQTFDNHQFVTSKQRTMRLIGQCLEANTLI